MTSVSKQDIVHWLENAAAKFAQEKDYLTELDRQIGDADHGINMNRGFCQGHGKASLRGR